MSTKETVKKTSQITGNSIRKDNIPVLCRNLSTVSNYKYEYCGSNNTIEYGKTSNKSRILKINSKPYFEKIY